MGRWKLGPQGGYYDPNDSGPDQYQPTPQEQANQGGGYLPPNGNTGVAGGVDRGAPMPSPTGSPQYPGDPNLPGYGDWNTSNPWRDSLSYEQMMRAQGGTMMRDILPPQKSGRLSVLNQLGSQAMNPQTSGAPKSGGGIFGSLFGGLGSAFGGLGSLTKSAGAAIGPYGTPR